MRFFYHTVWRIDSSTTRYKNAKRMNKKKEKKLIIECDQVEIIQLNGPENESFFMLLNRYLMLYDFYRWGLI